MDVVVKISNDYTVATTKAQFINPDELQFTDELVNSGSLSFRLPISDHQIFSIIEFRKVALYMIKDGTDKLLWTGYIDEVSNDDKYVYVKCGDEKDFLRNKMLFGTRNFSGVNVQTAFSTILGEANSRKGANEGVLTFEADPCGTTNVEKTFNDGTSYFDIIKQVCESLNLECKVLMNKVSIKITIGVNRTLQDANYKQFIWNINSPNENNISGFKNIRASREIATHVLGKSSGSSAIFEGDKSTFGSIERSVSMDNGNIAAQTQEYVNKHKISQIERDFDVNIDDEEAFNIGVGDLIPVMMVHGSALVDTVDNLKIIQRQFVFQNKKPTITIKVAKLTKEVANMENFLTDLNRRIKRFELY